VLGLRCDIRHTWHMKQAPFQYSFYVALLLSLLLSGCATYVATSGRVVVKDDRPTTRQESTPPPAARVEPRDARVAMVAGFSARDRLLIEEYFNKHRSKPGKRESLPAGFTVQERLSSHIKGQPLPRALEVKLTALPGAYVRLQVGRDVLLMERDTRIVLDLLRDVVVE
jgi:hypothetical protein